MNVPRVETLARVGGDFGCEVPSYNPYRSRYGQCSWRASFVLVTLAPDGRREFRRAACLKHAERFAKARGLALPGEQALFS